LRVGDLSLEHVRLNELSYDVVIGIDGGSDGGFQLVQCIGSDAFVRVLDRDAGIVKRIGQDRGEAPSWFDWHRADDSVPRSI
jgi:hypothetical protein